MNDIKILVLDVDGTLTDGKIYMGENGEVFKSFNCHDAISLRKLPKMGIETIIITGRKSKIVENRAKEMEILEIYQGIKDKKEKLDEILKEKNLTYKNVAYIGDDENDYDAMIKCKFKACPNDATDIIKNICDYVSQKKCSEAAVREIIDTKIDTEVSGDSVTITVTVECIEETGIKQKLEGV